MNGLCDQYREFYKGKLTTIDRFINKLFLIGKVMRLKSVKELIYR